VELDRALSLVRALNATPPREFVCRSPFLVMLLRRGAPLPFLAVWVETAALLRRR
jgi:hypothetical protein